MVAGGDGGSEVFHKGGDVRGRVGTPTVKALLQGRRVLAKRAGRGGDIDQTAGGGGFEEGEEGLRGLKRAIIIRLQSSLDDICVCDIKKSAGSSVGMLIESKGARTEPIHSYSGVVNHNVNAIRVLFV